MNANELIDGLETASYKLVGKEHELGGRAIILYNQAATMLRQQQADKDRALRILKEVDGVLLDYIEQLEKKPMTTLSNGRGVALAVKYMIAVLEKAQEK